MRDQVELDVRALPTWQRHPRIFAEFDGLEEGGELRIISDHEPRPLRSELEHTRPGRYVWLQHMLGNDLWEVTLRRLPAPHVECVAEFLKRCPLFADALPATLAELEAVATERVFAHNEPIVEQGADWDGFGLVWRGTLAAVITSPLGREHALYDILSCEPFGEAAAIDGGSTVARYVVTSRSLRVLLFPKSAVRAALDTDLALSRAMNDLCAQRMRAMIDRFAAQTSLPTVARVAAALLPHAGPEAGLQPVLATFQNLTQVELATAAGTVKEVVSRALAELEYGKAIERRGGHIVRVDRERLNAYANCL
jgi:uncharacterized protein (DUF2249 family)